MGAWRFGREWRREYNARLEEKRAASDAAVRARKEAAAKAISDYYETKETLREAKLNAGRSSEQEVIARLDEVASGNTWDRVLSLVRVLPRWCLASCSFRLHNYVRRLPWPDRYQIGRSGSTEDRSHALQDCVGATQERARHRGSGIESDSAAGCVSHICRLHTYTFSVCSRATHMVEG